MFQTWIQYTDLTFTVFAKAVPKQNQVFLIILQPELIKNSRDWEGYSLLITVEKGWDWL